MAENQDILSISFDYQRTQKEAGFVVSSLEPVLAIIEKLNSIKLNINSAVPTFAGAKKNADELTKSLKDAEKVKDALSSPVDLTKTISAYDRLKKSVNEAVNEARNLATQFGADSEQAIKAAESANVLKGKLKEIDDLATGKAFAEREKELKRLSDQQDADAAKKKASDEAELKRINALQAAETERAIQNQKNANVPFTHNLNTDGTVQEPRANNTGTVVTDIERMQVEGILTAKEYAASQRGVSAAFVETQQAAALAIVTEKELEAAKIAVQKANSENNVALQGYKLQQQEATKAAKEAAAAELGLDSPASIQRKKQMIAIQKAERDEMLAIQTEIKKREAEELKLAAAEQKEAKSVAELSNDYKQLSLAYNEAALKAKNLALQQGSNTPAAKAALEEANALGLKLKEVDGLTGSYNRNVGNYGNSITKAFSGAFSFIRQIAYILPGIGIAGILGAVSDVVIELVSALLKGKEAINTFAENYKNLMEVVANANKTAGTQIADLKILYSAATNVNLSIDQRKASVKALKEEFPDYFGKIGDEIILNGKAKDAYDLLSDAIIKSSRAKAAKAKIDDLEAQKLDVIFQNQKIENAANNEKARAQETSFRDEEGKAVIHYTKLQQEAIINQRKLKAQAEQDLKFHSLEQQEKFLIDFVGEKNITKAVIDEQTKRDKAKKEPKEKVNRTDFNDDLIKAQNEANKLLLQAQIDLNKSVYENDKLTYTQREMALNAYYDLERKLLYLNYNEQLQLNKEKRENDLKATGLSKEQIKAIKETEFIEQKNLDLKYTTDLQKLKLDQSKAVQDFEKNDIEKQKQTRFVTIAEREKADYDEAQARMKSRLDADKHFNDIASTIDATNSAKEQDALLDKFRAGKISREKYESDLFDIQLKYAQKGIQLQIDTINEELKTANVDYDTRVKLQQQLAELQLKLHQGALSQAQKNRDEIVKTLQEIQGYFNQFADVLGGAINIGITQQKNALQDLEDQQQKNYQNEIDRINNSTLSQQDKAAQLKILEAQRQAQKDTFDRKNREEDLKKAKFDKATAIANIILNTAVSVAKVLANPFLIAVTAALGAAQLAIAIATPLPRFFKGKDASNNYEGPAFVNDGGKVEPIKRADGSIEINPVAKPMVTFIGKDDIVYPSVEKFIEEHKLVQQKQPVINLPKQNAPLISIAQPTINVPETRVNISPSFIKILEKHTNSVIKSSYSVNELGKLINSISEVRNNSVTNAGSTSIKRIDTKINNSVHKPVITTSYFPTTTFKPISNQEINNIMQRSMNKQVVYMGNTTSTDQSIVVLRDIKDVLKKINSKETKTNVFVKNDASWKRYQDEYYRRG